MMKLDVLKIIGIVSISLILIIFSPLIVLVLLVDFIASCIYYALNGGKFRFLEEKW